MSGDTKSLFIIYTLGIFIRFWLMASEFQQDIADRIEVTTPVNSLYRITESHYRSSIGVDKYSSNVFHESPLHFHLYDALIKRSGAYLLVIYILCDVVTAHILYLFAKRYMLHLFIKQCQDKDTYSKDSANHILKASDFLYPPLYVAVTYLFNPYVIFNCAGYATTIFANLFLAVFLTCVAYGHVILGAISLAICVTHSLYPIVLLSPLYLSSLMYKKSKTVAAISIAVFFTAFIIFMASCYYLYNSWNFLHHTFGFLLGVTDQQPNVGVYWYFFMEMFEHFRLLFLYSYQINVTILYFIPLTIKFRKDPFLLATCFATLTAIFKSYPSIGDFGLTIALLPCWKHLYNCMQQIFISGVAIFVTTALAPILWDLWIYWGTANANFYFGATLAFITSYIFIITDVMFAYTKRDYLLKYGNHRKINGKGAKLVLD